ncbi:hypothetical protein ACTHAM_000754 [Cellulomonas soli]
MALLVVFAFVWFTGSLVALVVEIGHGATGTAEYRGRTFPAWVVYAVGIVLGGWLVVDGVAGWRATGPRHGVLDQVLEPTGVRLLRPRKWGRPQELLVERRERLLIEAELVYSGRAGQDRSYRFTVSGAAGTLRFDQSVHIEALTLAPLEDTARALGIEIVTTGAAEEIQRGAATGVLRY